MYSTSFSEGRGGIESQVPTVVAQYCPCFSSLHFTPVPWDHVILVLGSALGESKLRQENSEF